jgi:hypothetical protein
VRLAVSVGEQDRSLSRALKNSGVHAADQTAHPQLRSAQAAEYYLKSHQTVESKPGTGWNRDRIRLRGCYAS